MKVKKELIAQVLLVCGAYSLMGATVVETKIHSHSMDKDIPLSVIVPDDYSKKQTCRWPSVYILHGAFGNHSNHRDVDVKQAVDKYGFIAVCPDGGGTGWWIDSPVDPKMKYESHVVKEVLPYVDANFRTFADRKKRAIVGWSMGGHGACYIGFRSKEYFGAVGNIFGGVDLRPFAGKWGLDAVLGDKGKNPENWERFSVIGQLDRVKNGDVALISVIGTSDFFLTVNRDLHERLIKMGVEHDYVEVRAEDSDKSSHGPFGPRGMRIVARFLDNFFTTGKGS